MSKTKSSWSDGIVATSKWPAKLAAAPEPKNRLAERLSALDSMEPGSTTVATKTPEISVVSMAGGLRLPMSTERWCIISYDKGQWHYHDVDSQFHTDDFLELLVFAANKMEVEIDDEDLNGEE